MPKRPYDFDRDYRRPIIKAIAAYMAHRGNLVKDGRYMADNGTAIGTIPVGMMVQAGDEQVICKTYVVFSPTLAEMFDRFTQFAVDNYATARELAAQKAAE